MTGTKVILQDISLSVKSTARDAAARMLYQAECALHDARCTQIDEWIRMASDRLHDAVVRYEATLAA